MTAALRLIKGRGPKPKKWTHAKILPKAPGSTYRILAGGGGAPYLLEWDLYVNSEPSRGKP
ncbi:MAG: hypothetical protein HY928_14345 [Elusimicrobia bacterium]|nr:hypothetical protein [Elusimicrobiota bacterium]